jgi:hypothetical protein
MPAMSPELREEDGAGVAVVVWALEGVVVADVEVDVELVDEDEVLLEVGLELDAEEDTPERPLAVRLT